MSIKARLIFALSIILGLMASQMLITVSLIDRIASITEEISSDYLEEVREGNRLLAGILETTGSAEVPDDLMALFKEYLKGHEVGQSLSEEDYSGPDGLKTLAREITVLLEEDYERSALAAQEAEQVASSTRSLLTFALIMAALVEITLGWYLAKYISSGLSALVKATHRVARGDLADPVIWDYPDEFGELARSFNAMLESLKNAREENTLLHRQALKMQEDRIRLLRQHLSRTVKVQEDERKRVARELHDQAGQALTALKLGLGRLEKVASNEEMAREIASLRDLTIATMEDMRNLAFDLRPSMLDELGLVPAIRQYTREFARRTGLKVEQSLQDLPHRLPSEMETTIFRVIQEALTNIMKHAQATRVQVSLTFGNGIEVTVADDGCGFDVESALGNRNKKSLGLFGIRERVDLLGGTVKLLSNHGEGTVVSVKIPRDAISDVS